MGGVDVWIHVFLFSTLDGHEWSASLPGSPNAMSDKCGTLLACLCVEHASTLSATLMLLTTLTLPTSETRRGSLTVCSVGIATGYGLDVRGIGVRVPVGSRCLH
jgi:hypothetical protein